MDAQTYHDLNRTIRSLDSRLSAQCFGGGRNGMVPPECIAEVRQEIADALATIDALMVRRCTGLRALGGA